MFSIVSIDLLFLSLFRRCMCLFSARNEKNPHESSDTKSISLISMRILLLHRTHSPRTNKQTNIQTEKKKLYIFFLDHGSRIKVNSFFHHLFSMGLSQPSIIEYNRNIRIRKYFTLLHSTHNETAAFFLALSPMIHSDPAYCSLNFDVGFVSVAELISRTKNAIEQNHGQNFYIYLCMCVCSTQCDRNSFSWAPNHFGFIVCEK